MKPINDREKLAIEASDQGLWDWDLNSNEIYFSPMWKMLLGYGQEEILNIPESWLGRIHPDDLNRFNDAIEAHRQKITESFTCDYRLRHRDGSYRWMSAQGQIIETSKNTSRFVGLQRDITRQRSFQEQVRHDALHDHLTGLTNRILFMERITQACKRARRDETFKFAVLFLDLDKLKKINDSLGHAAGDKLLKTFAQNLKSTCREVDTVSRLGGDEFTIVQPEINSIEDVKHFAERIIEATGKPLKLESQTITPSVSIGIATNLEGNCEIRSLLRDADLALYNSKAQKGACYSVFEENMKSQFNSQFQMGISLRAALENNELQLFYQPIFNLETEKVEGMEVLLRWHHPNYGLVAPLDFIPLAEETDIINDLGQWVIKGAIDQFNKWVMTYPNAKLMIMHVNVSGRQLEHPLFFENLEPLLKNCDFPLKCLQFELTESVLATNPNIFKIQMHKLKELGLKFALDDFGTGFSSLSLIHQFPVDSLKIDRSFVTRIDLKPKTQKTVNSILQLAKDLELTTVAEGIETPQEKEKLLELGCLYGQGYAFSKPVAPHEFEKFLLEAPPRL